MKTNIKDKYCELHLIEQKFVLHKPIQDKWCCKCADKTKCDINKIIFHNK